MNKLSDIKVIGFDLGETLIEYVDVPLSWKIFYPEIFNKINEANNLGLSSKQIGMICSNLEKFNTRISPREIEFSAEHIFFDILNDFRIEDDVIIKKIIPQFFSFFQQRIRPFPETERTLNILKSKGYKIAIVTDVPYGMPDEFVFQDIKSFAGFIDKTVTSVTAGYRKPNPAGLQIIARYFDITPEEMIYIGNEPKDVEAAASFGCFPVLINRHDEKKNYSEKFQIKNLGELTDILN